MYRLFVLGWASSNGLQEDAGEKQERGEDFQVRDFLSQSGLLEARYFADDGASDGTHAR